MMDRTAALEPVALDRVEMFAQGLDHPEGISVLPDGTIFVGGEAGQIYRIDDHEPPREVANVGGFVLGLATDADGTLYVCSEGMRKVFRVDPSVGAVELLADGLQDRPMLCPNWPAFDEDGSLFVSDSGEWNAANGVIWVIRPGGRLEVWTEQSTDFPNGLAVALDRSRLYAIESYPGRIIEIPIDDDGSAGKRRVLCELGLTVPDGIAVAADGSLIVACYRPDVIYRWDRGDGIDVLVSDPQGTVVSAPTNVAFAGVNLEQLVFSNLAAWHLGRVKLGIRGTPLFRPRAHQVGA